MYGRGIRQLDISRVENGSIVRELVEEQRFVTKTLKHCQNLANRHEKGYSWETMF